MDSIYGVNVKNKFELFLDEDVDPLEILAKSEQEKSKVDPDKKKKDDKLKKNKNAKKPVLKSENKNKPTEEVIKPEKEEKANASRQNDRPSSRGGRQNRDDNRPPRRRDDNQENRDRPERSDRNERMDGGFTRPERLDGGQREGGFGRGEGGFGRGRGGRGARGRGARGGRGMGDRGGFGKREYDRHSGSERTSGVKATEKREGGGSHNWGTVKDDLDLPPKVDYWRDPKEQMKDTEEPTQDWNQSNEDVENKDPNESTDSANVDGEAEEDQPQQMTLDEWKKLEEAKRMKSNFKVRKANEGVDLSQWKNARAYRKSEGHDSDEEEEEDDDEEEEDEEEAKAKRLVNEIKITFNDSPRRGRGGRRPRGPRGGDRGSRRGGGDRRSPNVAPRFDDENDFPALNIKTAA